MALNTEFYPSESIEVYNLLSHELCDLCNQNSIEFFNPKTARELLSLIKQYLEGKKETDKIIDDYNVYGLNLIGNTVIIEIGIIPKYPAVDFRLNLEAIKSGDRMDFKTN
ncbi:MAG: hypothetical protein ACOYN4_01745 [Bacteroidales bacterium]